MHATTSNGEAVRHAEIIVLAVPPSGYSRVLVEVRNSLPSDAVVVSIMIRYRSSTFMSLCPPIRRWSVLCPSLMCEIGSGISLVTSMNGVPRPNARR